MSVISDTFLALVLAASAAFSTTYQDVPLAEQQQQRITNVQQNLDLATSVAYGSRLALGMVVIDRYDNNSTKSNDSLAHTSTRLESLTRLFILISAVKQDPKVSKNKVPDLVSMAQGHSTSATDKMWKKYGGADIVRTLSKQYNLQETETASNWRDVKSTAMDLGRLTRRFIDDKSVKPAQKRWVLNLLHSTSLKVAGEDFSWGFPEVFNVSEERDSKQEDSLKERMSNNDGNIAWIQGYLSEDGESQIRGSVAIFGPGNRYIAVMVGLAPKEVSREGANNGMTKTADMLINGDGGDGGNGENTSLLGGNNKDESMEDFINSELKKLGMKPNGKR